jgi:hypothetical protein
MNDLDMIYNMNDGKIMAGGYSVNSMLLNNKQSALYQEGGKGTNKVSDRFKNLAVPAGLLYINDTSYKNNIINDDIINDDIINDDIINDAIINDAIINDAIINDAIINDAIINDAIINDDIYEKLLHLAGPEASHNIIEKSKKQTRSKKGKGKKKLTKKHSRR